MKKIFLFALSAALTFGISIYIYFGSLTRMLADDFCSAYIVRRFGLLRAIWRAYTGWNGRYGAYAADWFVLEFTLGPYRVHYIVPIMLLLWFAALTLILYFYLKTTSHETWLYAGLTALVFLFTWLALSPNVEQSLFWWNAARSYSLPLFLLAVTALLLYLAARWRKLPAVFQYALSFALFFFMGGTGETYVVAQAGMLGILGVLIFLNSGWRHKRVLYILASGLAATLFSIVVIILAPGNQIRQSLLPPPPTLPVLLSVSFQAYGAFLLDVLVHPIRFAALIGSLLFFLWLGFAFPLKIRLHPYTIAITALSAFLISFVCFLPGVYGFSEPPPGRTISIPVFFLIVPLFCAAYFFGGQVTVFAKRETLLIGIFAALLIFSAAANSAEWIPRRQMYLDFIKKWDDVDAMILEAKAQGKESVEVPAMNNWAYLAAPSDNPNFWVTRCYRNYYDIPIYGPSMQEIIEIYQQMQTP